MSRLIDADAFIEMMENKCDRTAFADGMVLAICRGAINSMPTVPQWIPCSERMPDYDVEVLCYTTAHEFTVGYRMNDWGQDSWTTGAFASGTFEALAWMPLPEPYKEAE